MEKNKVKGFCLGNCINVFYFTIYGANGGHIVEVMRYDEKNDNERANRYIIADNESLTDSIGRIVTMEFLR